MKRRLFLSGPIGCGKSTLIKNALGAAARGAGGFVTLRVTEGERLLGFDLVPTREGWGGGRTESSAPADGYESGRRFLSFGAAGAVRDEGVFRDCAARLLREAKRAPFAVLDELGGFELCVPEFSSALTDLLQGGVPCVGVLKAPPAAAALKRRVGVPPGWEAEYEKLRLLLSSDKDSMLLETTGRYDEAAKAALCEWVRDYVESI